MVFLSGGNFGALSRRLAFGGGWTRKTPAAIIGEIADQRVHRFELGRIDHRAALAAHGDKTGGPQPIEMKGQRVRCEIERGCDRAGRHPLGSGLHQQAEHVEPIVLSERGQGCDDVWLFHISMIIEITSRRQAIFQRLSN
jgi:hypothetical protein